MSNIDKRALREAAEKASTDNHTQDEWFHYLRCPYNHYRVPLNSPVGSEDRAKEKLSSAWIELTANIHEAGK